MDQSNGVVIYRTEVERLFDQWFVHGGGWMWLVALLGAVLVIEFVFPHRRRNRPNRHQSDGGSYVDRQGGGSSKSLRARGP